MELSDKIHFKWLFNEFAALFSTPCYLPVAAVIMNEAHEARVKSFYIPNLSINARVKNWGANTSN